MHGEGDRSGGGVAEVVLDGVRHRECAGLVGCLIAYGVAGNEHQSLERALVILQIVLQAYRGAVGIGDVVEHIDGYDAVGTYLCVDVVGLRHGIRGGQRRRLQHDGAGRRSGRVRHAVGELHRFGRHLAGGDVHALVAHHAGFNAAGRIGLHGGDRQHAAHRIDIVGQRLHDGGVVRSEQRHVIGCHRFGGIACHGLHFHTSQTGCGNRPLRNGVWHIVGTWIRGGERERHIRRVHGGRSSVRRLHRGQLRRFGGSAMHVLLKRYRSACIGRGLLDHRIDRSPQRIGRFHREIQHAGASLLAVGHGYLDARPAGCHRAGIEHQLAVRARGDRHLIGVGRYRGDQCQRIAIRVGEAAQRVCRICGALLHVDFRWHIGLGRRMVDPVGDVQGHGGARRLAPTVADLVTERHRARSCGSGVQLQVPTVVYGRDGDVTAVRCARRGDAQHRTVGLFIVA